MRASVLFFFNFLVFLALVALVAAKMTGYFDEPEVSTVDPPEVVIAARRLPEGVAIDRQYASTRPMTREEYESFLASPAEFLPADAAAVAGRVTARSLDAGEAIMRSDLVDDSPERLRDRIAPGMRPVDVAVLKKDSQGGLIQTGDWVDVSLTTEVYTSDDEDTQTIRTAVIARGVRVILKRNTLLPIYRGIADDELIPFTLEANPYRAALIDYAVLKGNLTLTALPDSEQAALEEQRESLIETGESAAILEDEDERERIERILAGNYSVGDEDLADIFGLEPISTPPVPEPPPRVQVYSGVDRKSDVVFISARNPQSESDGPLGDVNSSRSNTQSLSDFVGQEDVECENCDEYGRPLAPTQAAYRFRRPVTSARSEDGLSEFGQLMREQQPPPTRLDGTKGIGQ